MKLRCCVLIIFSFLSSFCLYAQYFKHLGMKEGLSQLSVLAIYQDELGRMWFGTREGVNVYDGKHISVYKPWSMEGLQNSKHLLAGNEVNMIVGNDKGDIFMRTEGALVKYDIHKETFTQLRASGVRTITSYKGNVWCVVLDSLYTYDSQVDSLRFLRTMNLPYVSSLLISGEKMWVGTHRGLFLIEGNSSKCLIPDVEIYRLFESSRKELWIASRMDGLYRIERDGRLVKAPYDPRSKNAVISNQIRGFAEDEQENIWFGTFDGVQMYNPYTYTYQTHRQEHRAGALSHSSVFSLYKDKQGTIWMGTYYGGVNYFNPGKDLFSYYPYNVRRNDCLNFPLVGPMIEDKERLLWICTDGGGVNCLNRKSGVFTYYTASGNNALLHNNSKSICYDKKRDYIYIGTYTGGLSRYDKKTGKFHNYLEDYKKDGKGPNNVIFQVEFKNERLYVSSRNGFFVMDPDTNEFRLINKDGQYLNFEIDSKGYAWLSNGTNLYRLNLKTSDGRKLFPLKKTSMKYKISKILESSDGTMYIGTMGNGFFAYDLKKDSLSHYTVENSNILSNYCYNLLESPKNNVLVTNDRGITLFSPFTQSARSIELGTGGGITAITDGCGMFVTSDEQIFVGGVDGMISFREEDLDIDDEDMKLYFSGLHIQNARVYPDDGTGVLQESLPFTQKLDLASNQNNLIIDFSSSNYVDILKNTWYEYKLEGFDKDWIPTTRTSLYYTNLQPGRYTLKVREMGNSLNTRKQEEIALGIIVHNPWYNTLWAWIIYLLMVGIIVYWLWHTKATKKILARSLQQEKVEKERIEELNHVKLRFFTNISHEFRTPLTLIIGQIESMLQLHKMSPSVYNRLLRVHKNAMHMRFLISELLDFRKQEQGYMKLKVSQRDLVAFNKDIYMSFYEYAQKRNITYSFEHADDIIDLWFDPVQLQKVIFNLLSNAFKYTPEKGTILVELSRNRNQVKIKISDSGCGISEEVISKIFERFYQVDSSDSGMIQGTGIGLALSKGIVESHKGEIYANSVLGEGSTFTVLLPMGNSHFSVEELKYSSTSILTVDDEWTEKMGWNEIPEDPVEETDTLLDKPVILLVEDSQEITEMLEEIFSPIYQVHKASNGEEGLEMTRQIQPDIVLSDVMMPIMSGKEMCYKIKNSFDVSHIPVVLLTAQTSVEYTIEGYMFGADDYITKPFNVKLLVSRCNNLVKNRKLLLEKFMDNEKPAAKATDAMTVSDKKLIDKATDIIKRNFENSEFDMNMLASELGMGRSKLFTRIKEVTGLTPNEFTLKLKLEEAMRLLKDELQYNISEITYKLGFTSPRYFSRCFKTFYGVTPQTYRKG